MHMSTHATLAACHERLSHRRLSLCDELERRELSQGKSHDVRKINRIREEISKIDERLAAIERVLQ